MAAFGFGARLALQPVASAGVVGFDFAAPALPAGATLTRASAGTRYTAVGLLVSEAADVARFDHNPATGAYRGLLVEPATSNALYPSNAFGSPWTASGGAVSQPGDVLAPDGSAAWRLGDSGDGTTGSIILQRTYNASAGPQPTSIFARAGTRRLLRGTSVAFTGASGTLSADFDLVAGTASAGDMVALGGGWFRCGLVPVIDGGDLNGQVRWQLLSDAGVTTMLRDGGNAVYVFGAQSEDAAQRTSYMPTGASAGSTRAADVLTLAWGAKGVADGAITVRYTFDDGSTQDVATVVSGGVAAVPTGLARTRLRRAVRV